MRRRELMLLLGGAGVARAAEGDAGDRVPQRRLVRPVCSVCGRGSRRAERKRLCRGAKFGDRIRWAEGHYDRLPALAADLVGHTVNAILAGGDEPTLTAKSATSTIPIVFVSGDDPVDTRLVASFARPGGNLTGVSFLGVELLSDLISQAGVIALLVNPNNFNDTSLT